jgi:hypothetical protein
MKGLDDLGERKKDLLALLLLVGLATLFFANVLFTDKVLVGDNLARYSPWNYYEDPETQAPINYEYDTLLAYYPQIFIARQMIESGNLPLWNPDYLSGIPFLAATPWLGFFYPFYVLFYVADPLQAFGYVSFVQLLLGGVFMYLYLRSIECSRPAALVGSVSFELGGFLLGNLTWLPRVSVVIWTPLMFLCVEKLLQERRWIYALLGAYTVAMSILAGNIAVTIYVILALGLYCVVRLGAVLRDEGVKVAMRYALLVVISVSTGILLSAVQLVPTYEVAQFASRVHVPYDERIESGRSFLALGTMVVPDIFGNPVDRSWGRNVFAKNIPGTYGETSMYIGIVPLFLVIWALIRRRHKYTIFFASLAILSFCMFLDTPLFRLLYDFPLFRIGRQLEAKVMGMFAASVLVALGFTSLMESAERRERRLLLKIGGASAILAAVVVLMVCLGVVLLRLKGGNEVMGLAEQWYVYNVTHFLRLALLLFACALLLLSCARSWRRANVNALLAIGVMVADLAYFGWRLNPARSPERLYPEMDSVRFLQSDTSIFRTIRGPLSRKVFPPNSLVVYGIADAQGYSPVLLDYYVDFLNLIEDDISSSRRVYSLRYPASLSSRLLDLLNVKYVITIAEPGEEMARVEQTDDEVDLVYDGEVKIYENRDVLPRTFVVADHKVLQEEEDVFAELTGQEFDPASYVILEQDPESRRTRAGALADESTAEILEYKPNRVIVNAEMSSDGFLVLSDLYYSGWRAFVDGEEQKVYKADYIFRAVQLGGGRHIVEFVFDPPSFKAGFSISVLALLIVSALSVYAMVRWK